MKIYKIMIAVILGMIGTWLLLWDFIDYLTKGINKGIWDFTIVQQGFPSIFLGFVFLLIACYMGLKIWR